MNNIDTKNREVNSLQEQLKKYQRLMLCEVDGMYACLQGVTKSPYEGEEHMAWSVGYKMQQQELEASAKLVEARQAIRNQAEYMEELVDVQELKDVYGEKWWLEVLSPSARESLAGTPVNTKNFERIVKAALSLVMNRSFSLTAQGLEVDKEKGEYFEDLYQAVEQYLNDKLS